MGKIVAWLILIFVVLLALRIAAMRNARVRRRAESGGPRAPSAEAMVRCARCGVFLPRAEARALGDGYACASGPCAAKS